MSSDVVKGLEAFLPPGSIVPGWLVQDAINEIERLRYWIDLLAANNCYCGSDNNDDIGLCVPCLYRLTVMPPDDEEARLEQ